MMMIFFMNKFIRKVTRKSFLWDGSSSDLSSLKHVRFFFLLVKSSSFHLISLSVCRSLLRIPSDRNHFEGAIRGLQSDVESHARDVQKREDSAKTKKTKSWRDNSRIIIIRSYFRQDTVFASSEEVVDSGLISNFLNWKLSSLFEHSLETLSACLYVVLSFNQIIQIFRI